MAVAKRKPKSPKPVAVELRDWTRFKVDNADTVLVVASGKHEAVIYDESFGGLGLLVDHSPVVHAGDQVIVLYYGTPVAGVVARVVSSDIGMAIVGIQWPQACRRQRAVREKAAFVAFSGFDVACRIIRKDADTVVVRLPDGTRIETAPKDITVKTRAHRRTELARSDADVYILTALYKLGGAANREAAVRAILGIEFAANWP